MVSGGLKATLEKIEDNKAHISIEVEAEEVGRALQGAYRRVARQVAIPGFRKGRAPRAILERYVGSAVIHEEALDDLLPMAYAEAVHMTGIEPIDQPSFPDLNAAGLKDDEPFKFSIEVEVKPEVVPGDYEAIRIEHVQEPVTDEQIDETLQSLRERTAHIASIDDPNAGVADGHIVTLTAEKADGDEDGVGGDGEDQDQTRDTVVEVGTGQVIESFEEQIKGMKVGEIRDVSVEYPDDFDNEELRGKTVSYTVHIKEIKKREYPPIDDDLARTVGPFETLEELKADIRSHLEKQAEREADDEHRKKVLEAVTEQVDLIPPKVLVDQRFNDMVNQVKPRLEAAGIPIEDYLQLKEEDSEETYGDELRRRAATAVKTDLILEAIAEKEGIEPTEQDLLFEAHALARQYDQPPEAMRNLMEHPDARRDMAAAITLRKTAAFLMELARGRDKDEALAAWDEAMARAQTPPEGEDEQAGGEGEAGGEPSGAEDAGAADASAETGGGSEAGDARDADEPGSEAGDEPAHVDESGSRTAAEEG